MIIDRLSLKYLYDKFSDDPPRIWTTIFPSDDLPSIFIKHSTNKVEKIRASIASEHVTSTLGSGTTTATLSSAENVSQSTVKDCNLNLLLFGTTHDVTSYLQRLQNYAVRVILRLLMSSTHFKSLHWISVNVRST